MTVPRLPSGQDTSQTLATQSWQYLDCPALRIENQGISMSQACIMTTLLRGHLVAPTLVPAQARAPA